MLLTKTQNKLSSSFSSYWHLLLHCGAAHEGLCCGRAGTVTRGISPQGESWLFQFCIGFRKVNRKGPIRREGSTNETVEG